MNELQKAHDAFGQIWKMFNAVRKNNTNEGWEECAKEARRIAAENPGRMYEEIILTMIEEAEEESKITDMAKRQERYRNTAKAFNAAWELYESLMTRLDINAVMAYCYTYSGTMAKTLGAAIYKAACGAKKGTFMEAAYQFYAKYQNGADETAVAEAEALVDRYPEHTLQVMELYAMLKQVSDAA